MDFNARASIHNRFDVEVVDIRTGKIRQRAQGLNVICENLFTQIQSFSTSGNPYCGYIQFGSGSGTPQATDTALFARFGEVKVYNTSLPTTWSHGNGVVSVTRSISLSETQHVGRTFSEVGISKESGDGQLCTHAMLLDMNGNPITIVKTNTDILNISATLFLHWSVEGYQNAFHMPRDAMNPAITQPQDYPSWVKWLLGQSYGQTSSFYLYHGNMSGTAALGDIAQYKGVSSKTYNPTTRSLTLSFTRIRAEEWNFSGGIGSFQLASSAYEQMIGVKATDFMTLGEINAESIGSGDGTKAHFSTKFIRDTRYPMKVYVNGQETLGYQYSDVPITSDGAMYVIPIDDDSTDGNLIYLYKHPMFGCITGISGLKNTITVCNPYYQTHGITGMAFTSGSARVEASNDLVSWTAQSDTISEYKNYKYFRFRQRSGYFETGLRLTIERGYNIVFNDPPEVGAAITVDYVPLSVPKDSNHVLDVSFTISFGEYTPE